MYKNILILLLLWSSLLTAENIEKKDKNYEKHYSHSSHKKSKREKLFLSTSEASSRVSILLTLDLSSELTYHGDYEPETLSFLDNNRIDITAEMAEGEGEHLETLLSMMKLKKSKEHLSNIQSHFDELIYLSHVDFLKKLETL